MVTVIKVEPHNFVLKCLYQARKVNGCMDSILPLSTICVYWNLELFQQCGIS